MSQEVFSNGTYGAVRGSRICLRTLPVIPKICIAVGDGLALIRCAEQYLVGRRIDIVSGVVTVLVVLPHCDGVRGFHAEDAPAVELIACGVR